jgi:hypothetical protein
MDRQQIVWTDSKLCGQTADRVDRTGGVRVVT